MQMQGDSPIISYYQACPMVQIAATCIILHH